MSFEAAYGQTSKFEGGYVWDKADPGGETYRGITRNSFPKWSGWNKVDEAKTLYGYQPKKIDSHLAGDPQLAVMVEVFYRREFWEPLGRLPDLVKMKTFDFSVNAGQGNAVKVLQRALNSLGARLAVDGKLGPTTRAAAEAADPGATVDGQCRFQAEYYLDRIKKNPALGKFKKGWLNRAKWKPVEADS